MSVGPASDYFKTGAIQEGNKDFAGELSVTLVDTQKLLLMSFLDFHLLVANRRKQRLSIQVKDSFGFTDFTIGTGEVELGSLQDTVPTQTAS
ncbi:uncharacterized protein LOC131236863 isoform X7 [Magnolia sinica]|uniref:uncharacterized protein LOC131236863 isoform X7 n=1 Tax=Magnolia sinica TaxID=86752 RepID=UPI002657E8AF|nr:uncharacterized protein LOC131236863 isoform X7 [Magnolia sinica]